MVSLNKHWAAGFVNINTLPMKKGWYARLHIKERLFHWQGRGKLQGMWSPACQCSTPMINSIRLSRSGARVTTGDSTAVWACFYGFPPDSQNYVLLEIPQQTHQVKAPSGVPAPTLQTPASPLKQWQRRKLPKPLTKLQRWNFPFSYSGQGHQEYLTEEKKKEEKKKTGARSLWYRA